MRLSIETMLHYQMHQPVDVLLAIEGAPMADQLLISDSLVIAGVGPLTNIPGEEGIGRRTWMHAEGMFLATYKSVFDVDRPKIPIGTLGVSAHNQLPALVIPYLWPSRYCEADRFEALVRREFGHVQGGEKVLAMADWIHSHLDYCMGTSDATTTAVDSYVSRQGVCRDFAHLMASFARAAGIPARVVSAYAWELSPPDFHAVVEVWLEDGWHMVDATKLAPVEGLVRIAVGRDATDIAFMTVFGNTQLIDQRVSVTRLE